jgi:hypothetical protein
MSFALSVFGFRCAHALVTANPYVARRCSSVEIVTAITRIPP